VNGNNQKGRDEVVTAEDVAEELAAEEALPTEATDAEVTEGPEAERLPEDQEATEEELSLEERLEAAEAQAAEYLEGWQRARAEFSNARKRLEKSRLEARRKSTVEVIGKLLPILDDFGRALENVPEAIAADEWFEGIALINRKLRGILDEENIERIDAVGTPFDPNYHEAVMQEESDEYESGVVIKELQSGYRLGERVIRPAMVIVAA
jgi:molecular chaperone GrpE